MKRFVVLISFSLLLAKSEAQIVNWTFEISIPTTAGPHAAEVGTGSTTGFHAAATTYSNPVGNGSAESFSSTNWLVGDYYQFQFATTGYQDISISWDHNSSGTGPANFKVQYSTDGTIFTDATGTNSTYTIPNGITWSSTTPTSSTTWTHNLNYATALNNAATVYIRLVAVNTTSTGGGTVAVSGTSRVDNFTVNGTLISSATDYFRSITSGDWNTPSTWEQSPDNITWTPASTVPNSTANMITIRNSHNVTLSVSTSADQVIVQNGGVLIHNGGTFTINDGTGNDIDIQSGGIFTLSSAANPPQFSGTSPTVVVNSGSILRVAATGLTAAAPSDGVNVSNYIYENQSILEFTPNLPFTTASNTFFPNVNTTTIPIFRVNNSSPITVGASTFTTFNGVFESAGAGVNWQFGGIKTFRNGITGSGDVTAISTSGTFVINGTTATLGGTGLIFAPLSGLQVGPNSTVTMISNKSVTNNISLLADSYIDLGVYNLSVSGIISGGSTNAYIRTNSTGTLILNTVIPGSSKSFPIGNTSFNPVTITNNGANIHDYNARVENGINSPGPLLPTYGIDRTWYIGASAVAPSTSITFQYAAADANPGVLPTEEMEILRSDFTSWSILPGNMNILPVGTNPYTVSTATAITVNNSAQPYAIGKTGGYILPLDYFIVAKAEKRNTAGLISWNVFETGDVKSFELQRSVNNGAYTTIGNISPENNKLSYSYFETNLPAGTNLYRIKVNRNSGAVRYSNVVALINDTKGLLITSLMPNPVTGSAVVTVSAARSLVADIQLVNVSGTSVRQWRSAVAEGSNQLTIDMSALPAGVYHLVLQTPDSKAVYRLVKQ